MSMPELSVYSGSVPVNQPVSAPKRNLQGLLLPKRWKKFVPVAVFMVLALFAAGIVIRRLKQPAAAPSSEKVSIAGPIASQTLNKTYEFPLKDAQGKEIAKISYTLENAELRDEIIVQGRRAEAIQGRRFLIVTIKIKNSYEKAVNINARDYIRLTVNGNKEEQLAADIHNDPVSVQPISTKITRIGFPINETDKNLVLHIGEIKGQKQDLALEFR